MITLNDEQYKFIEEESKKTSIPISTLAKSLIFLSETFIKYEKEQNALKFNNACLSKFGYKGEL